MVDSCPFPTRVMWLKIHGHGLSTTIHSTDNKPQVIEPEMGPAGLKVKGKVRFWAWYWLRIRRDMLSKAATLVRQDRITPLSLRLLSMALVRFIWLRTFME